MLMMDVIAFGNFTAVKFANIHVEKFHPFGFNVASVAAVRYAEIHIAVELLMRGVDDEDMTVADIAWLSVGSVGTDFDPRLDFGVELGRELDALAFLHLNCLL